MRKCKWKNRTIMIAALFCLMAVLMPMSALADTFTDTGSHWAKDKIESWAEKGYVSGYQDGSFKPDQNITRAEFMVIVNKAFGFTKTAPIDFSDVKDGAWYYDTIAAAKAAGYISGDPAGTMRPDDPITREEAASIIMRLKNLTANEAAASQFTDAALITWSKGAVGAVADAGIMKGYPDGSFQPKKFITRAEAIVALYAAIDYENEKPDTPTKPEEPVTPEAPNVTADDFLNKVYGMTTAMEYKLDDGQWVRYDTGEFAKLDLGGKHTLLVRYAAEGINPAGPAITLKFTSPRSGGGSGKITTPEWAATGDLIRSDEDGSVYTSYILMYGAKQIPLTEENIASFRVLEPGEEEPTDLIPDADPLLWFDILNAPGDYVYTVKTKAGVTYKATLTWTVPKPVEASATGKAEVDVSEGILRAEYQLIDEETPIDLSTYTKLYRILPDAEATIEDLGEPDEESTVLWFSPFMNEGLPLGGNYLYLLLKDEIWYTTTIPFNMALGNLEPTGQIEVSEEVLNIAFELMDEEGNSIPLTDDNIDYILEVYTAGLDDFVVKNPLPDNDPLLWFNVEKPAGVYGYLFTT